MGAVLPSGQEKQPVPPPSRRPPHIPPETAPASDSLFRAATCWEGLHAGWERVRANNGAAGGDGMSVERFGQGVEARLSRLSHDLVTGRYRPAPSRRVYIPKDSGGVRPLDIPAVADRVAQAAVALVLTPMLEPEFEDASFAYRPGRSVAQAVARVGALRRQGYTHVVDGDIVRYFERVPHERLLVRLERHVNDPSLIDLVGLWLEHHSHAGLGLPQGSPLSPLLANLYLDDIDEAIEGQGVRLVRFADDFVLLCKGEAVAAGARQRIGKLLAGHGLELHPDKTRIVTFDQGLRFLGHVFVKGMIWKEIEADATPPSDAIDEAERLNALAAKMGTAAQEAPPEPEPDETPASGRWAARQRVLYMLEPGRKLTAEAESFVVREVGEGEIGPEVLRLPHGRVARIELGMGTGLDETALDLAAASGTMIARVDGFGRTLGLWTPAGHDSAALQLAQAGVVADAARRIALARIIVAGRIQSQRMHLKRLARGVPNADIAAAGPKLHRMMRAALLSPRVETLPKLMGQEGEAAALYWPLLAQAFAMPEFFRGSRRRRAGADPLNAVLDLLSSFLARDITVAVRRHGLHPGFGVLHTAEDGAEALAYDLMEEFRAPIVEACALALFGRKALMAEHFSEWGEGAQRMWRLTREGYAACVRGYEAWLARPVRGQRSGHEMLWRGVFEEQALAYAAHCRAEASYEPYRLDY